MSNQRFLPAIRLTMSLFVLCLIASTWPLWTGSSSFPQIPFFESLCGIGPWADTLSLMLILAGAVSTLVGSAVSLRASADRERKAFGRNVQRLELAGLWILAAGLFFATLLNQHRLQPWAWHFLLISLLLAPRSRWSRDASFELSASRSVLTMTGIIYFFSAISKLDQTFSSTYGPQFLEALLNAIGVSSRFWSESARQNFAVLIPLSELAISVSLFVRRTRRLGLILSILMHGLLLLAVGPLGLNHQPGVLLWNVFFIVQNLLLWKEAPPFLKEVRSVSASKPPAGISRWSPWHFYSGFAPPVFARLLLFLGLFIPLLRFAGMCDPWPAWAVYASQPERVTILIDEKAAGEMPEELRRFLRPRRLDDGRVFFRADLWSIDATGAPIYPGARFPVAIAGMLNDRPELHGNVDLVVEGPAGWWSGERESDEYSGQGGIDAASALFWLNTKVRFR